MASDEGHDGRRYFARRLPASRARRRRPIRRSLSPIVIPLAAGGAVDTMVAHHGRLAARVTRPADPGRERRRRRRHHGHRSGRAGGARRLHDQRRHLGHARRQFLHLFAALRSRDRFRDGRAAAERAALWFIARKNLSPANLQELVAYMKANKVTAGSVGAGGSSAVCSLLLPESDWYDRAARAVSRRRPGAAGHRRRQRRHDVRSGGETRSRR